MLVDTFCRTIDYLRVSVIKQCNFRCQYCMPNTAENAIDSSALPLNKMLEFIKIAIDNGIKKIRITGGEPLLRNDLCAFINEIHKYAPQVEIALTTNAFLLHRYAQELKEAGLKRLNISLDSLKSEKIKLISKFDGLENILRGIHKAAHLGLGVKLNMVVLKGINDDELLDMLQFARTFDFGLRFIEFMENIHAKDGLKGLMAADMLNIISTRYVVKMLQKEHFGPAKLYEIVDSSMTKPLIFGIISPHQDDFCKTCNRIRLTSEGVIYPCLYYQESVDVKEAILNGDRAQMQRLLRLSIHNKPEKNQWESKMSEELISKRAFYQTGG